MALPVWVDNLIAYTLQIAVLVAAGTLLAYVFRLRVPQIALLYYQVLLLTCLFVFALQPWNHSIYLQGEPAVGPSVSLSPLAMAMPVASHEPFRFEPDWIMWILGAGMFLRLVWLALGLLRLRFFRRRAHRLSEEPALIEEVRMRTGIRVPVLFSDEIDTPVTFGARSPAVILPFKFNDMNAACRRAVLCHELLHIQRHNWLFIFVEEAIRAVFWFHPAILWLIGRIRLSREQVVDYEVVRLSGDRRPYLDSLLEFARAHGRPKAVPAPLFLRERHLVQRVGLLLREASMSRSRLFISLTFISILLFGTIQLLAAWFPLTGEPVRMQEEIEAVPTIDVPKFAPAENPETKTLQERAVQVRPALENPKPVSVAMNSASNIPEEKSAHTQETAPASMPSVREPIRVGGNIQESNLIYKVEPVYPEKAKRARINGRVLLIVTTDKEGLVSDIKVNSGHPMLIDAAVSAVKQWRYRPTLLNGMPVPVIFTVTCVFNFMGEDDVMLAMDENGDIRGSGQNVDIESWIPKMMQGGTAYIDIAPVVPFQTAQKAIQGLLQRGVQKIQLSGPFTLYQGTLFYTGPPAKPPQIMPNMERLRALLDATPKPTNPGAVSMLYYSIYINEVGEIVGVQRIAGSDNQEIDQELLRASVLSPALLGADPVPFMYSFRMGF